MHEITRIPIIISGSTVHEHYMEGDYVGDNMHVDYLTSPGAKIEDLLHMWRLEYNDERKPMDIVLIGGLNNFKTDSNKKMMEKFRDFADAVRNHSAKNHPPSEASTFRLTTLLLAPQFVWFDGNGDKPTPDYDNQLDKMTELNKSIVQLNQDEFHKQTELCQKKNAYRIYNFKQNQCNATTGTHTHIWLKKTGHF